MNPKFCIIVVYRKPRDRKGYGWLVQYHPARRDMATQAVRELKAQGAIVKKRRVTLFKPPAVQRVWFAAY